MFVKVYQYHIRPESEQELLHIQQKAGEIYSNYIEVQTTFLQNKEDETLWTEISSFQSEENYHKMLPLINKDPRIQDLYRRFEFLLISGIKEESYIIKKMKIRAAAKRDWSSLRPFYMKWGRRIS
jgi:hypothetical protein